MAGCSVGKQALKSLPPYALYELGTCNAVRFFYNNKVGQGVLTAGGLLGFVPHPITKGIGATSTAYGAYVYGAGITACKGEK